jgi:hypothetical protein
MVWLPRRFSASVFPVQGFCLFLGPSKRCCKVLLLLSFLLGSQLPVSVSFSALKQGHHHCQKVSISCLGVSCRADLSARSRPCRGLDFILPVQLPFDFLCTLVSRAASMFTPVLRACMPFWFCQNLCLVPPPQGHRAARVCEVQGGRFLVYREQSVL